MAEEEAPTDLFRERLKSARELRGYSQEDLAKLARMPPSSIAHFSQDLGQSILEPRTGIFDRGLIYASAFFGQSIQNLDALSMITEAIYC